MHYFSDRVDTLGWWLLWSVNRLTHNSNSLTNWDSGLQAIDCVALACKCQIYSSSSWACCYPLVDSLNPTLPLLNPTLPLHNPTLPLLNPALPLLQPSAALHGFKEVKPLSAYLWCILVKPFFRFYLPVSYSVTQKFFFVSYCVLASISYRPLQIGSPTTEMTDWLTDLSDCKIRIQFLTK